MARKQLLCICIVGLFAVGCEKKSEMAMSHDGKMPPMPQRPVELDKLNDMVGNWTSTGTCTMAGSDKPITMNSSSTNGWDCGRWCMVERMEGPSMMGDGSTFHGMNVITYDAHDHVFKNAWMDSGGDVSHGTMQQDGPHTWKAKGTSRNTVTGETSTSEGTMKFVDANTIEWTWCQYAGGKKVMEMKGTNKRKM